MNIEIEQKDICHSTIEEVHNGFLMFGCPYTDCNTIILVHRSEVNCGIFRCHALLMPHATKEACDALEPDNYGCRRPFEIKVDNMKAYVCGYK